MCNNTPCGDCDACREIEFDPTKVRFVDSKNKVYTEEEEVQFIRNDYENDLDEKEDVIQKLMTIMILKNLIKDWIYYDLRTQSNSDNTKW